MAFYPEFSIVGTVDDYRKRLAASLKQDVRKFEVEAAEAPESVDPGPPVHRVLGSLREMFPNIAPVPTIREAFTVAA